MTNHEQSPVWTNEQIYNALWEMHETYPDDGAPIIHCSDAETICQIMRDAWQADHDRLFQLNEILVRSLEIQAEAKAEISERLDAANARIAEPSVPNDVREAIAVCANYGMPLGITYSEYNTARDRAIAWLDEQKAR